MTRELVTATWLAAILQLTSAQLNFDPPTQTAMMTHSTVIVQYSFNEHSLASYCHIEDTISLYLGINAVTERADVGISGPGVVPSGHANRSHDYMASFSRAYACGSSNTTANQLHLSINQIGYTVFNIDLLAVRGNLSTLLANQHYRVTAQRKHRLVDGGFDGAVIVLVVINTFALGCITDLSDIRGELKGKKLIVGLALLVQSVITPLVTFALAFAVGVQHELTLGFLLATCITGGGLGYLIVAITSETDLALSVLLNLLHLVIPIGSVPLWVYTLSRVLLNGSGHVHQSMYLMVLWLLGLTVPYAVGVITRRFSATVAEAFLNWLVKPTLLLAFILFITLGLYINMYMFAVLRTQAIVFGALIPFVGFGVGGGIMLAAKQGKLAAKTVSIESAIMNCLVALIAARFSLPQPDADLASAAILWLLFVTPVPFVLMFIFHRMKRKVMFYFDKKDFQKNHDVTLKHSFAAITQNAFKMSGVAGDVEAPKKHAEQGPSEDIGDTMMLLLEASHDSNNMHNSDVSTNECAQTSGPAQNTGPEQEKIES